MDTLVLGVDAIVDPILQRLRGDGAGLTQNDRSQWRLTPLFTRNAKHSRLANRGMLHQDFFNIFGEYVDAPGNDHVFLAVYQEQESILVNVAEIARAQPAV